MAAHSRLSALSVDSPYAEMEPRSRTERGRENRPGLWPILPNTVCRRLATLARVPMCRAARLCARLVPTATQITKFPPSCARHAHLAGTTVTARRRRAAPPCAAGRDDREQRSRVAPARQKRWLLTPEGKGECAPNPRGSCGFSARVGGAALPTTPRTSRLAPAGRARQLGVCESQWARADLGHRWPRRAITERPGTSLHPRA